MSTYHNVRSILLDHGSSLPSIERLSQTINLGGGDGGEVSFAIDDIDGDGEE